MAIHEDIEAGLQMFHYVYMRISLPIEQGCTTRGRDLAPEGVLSGPKVG